MKKGDIQKALQEGKRSRIAPLLDNLWKDVPETLRLSDALLRISGEIAKGVQFRKDTENLIAEAGARIRESFLTLAVETVGSVGKAYVVMTAAKEISYGVQVFLGCGESEYNRAVRVIDKLNEARLDLFVRLFAGEEVHDNYMGVNTLLGMLMEQAHVSPTWKNFFGAVTQGYPDARAVFERFFTFFSMCGRETQFHPLSQKPRRSALEMLKNAYLAMVAPPSEPYVCYVPDDILPNLGSLIDAFAVRFHKGEGGTIRFFEWVERNRDDLTQTKMRLWQEIVSAPRYGIRSGGIDRISLCVDEANSPFMSYEAIQFFPEDFPRVRAKVWIQFLGKPLSVNFLIQSANALIVVDNPALAQNYAQSSEAQFLHLAALHCYWKIVTGRFEEKTPLVKKDVASEASRRHRSVASSDPLTPVRPHFRRLPFGHRISEEAILRAQAVFGHGPPEGMTFVREHERGYTEMQNIKPLFAYTAEDLGYYDDISEHV